jgi:hypothetical protein
LVCWSTGLLFPFFARRGSSRFEEILSRVVTAQNFKSISAANKFAAFYRLRAS